MKIPKINMQDVLKSATDKSVISFRANGRTWTFAPGDKITCFDGLTPLVQNGVLDDKLFDLLVFDFDTLKSVLPFVVGD